MPERPLTWEELCKLPHGSFVDVVNTQAGTGKRCRVELFWRYDPDTGARLAPNVRPAQCAGWIMVSPSDTEDFPFWTMYTSYEHWDLLPAQMRQVGTPTWAIFRAPLENGEILYYHAGSQSAAPSVGESCNKCGEFARMAEKNWDGGKSFRCYQCRQDPWR